MCWLLDRDRFWRRISSAKRRQSRLGPKAPTESLVVRTYPLGAVLPSRSVETRSDSSGREVVTETIEFPDLDGRVRPTMEAITETIRTAPNAVQIKRDV